MAASRERTDAAREAVPPADREWGFCRRLTPELLTLLERKQLTIPGADHVVVLKLDRWSVLLAHWAGDRVLGYQLAAPSVGRDIVRLGAPESV